MLFDEACAYLSKPSTSLSLFNAIKLFAALHVTKKPSNDLMEHFKAIVLKNRLIHIDPSLCDINNMKMLVSFIDESNIRFNILCDKTMIVYCCFVYEETDNLELTHIERHPKHKISQIKKIK